MRWAQPGSDDPSVYMEEGALFNGDGSLGDEKVYEQWEEACVEGSCDVDTALQPSGASPKVAEN